MDLTPQLASCIAYNLACFLIFMKGAQLHIRGEMARANGQMDAVAYSRNGTWVLRYWFGAIALLPLPIAYAILTDPAFPR